MSQRSRHIASDRIIVAMQVFDQDLRGTEEWSNWQNSKTHRYAIRYGDQLYPVKKIISLAGGANASDFSDGPARGDANHIVIASGFSVVPLHAANPNWTRDEQIIALNFYRRHRPNLPGHQSKKIESVSVTLNRLGARIFPESARSDTFRNANGVYMKLMNFRGFDPLYTARGKKGLTAGAQGEEMVWREFAGDPRRCHEVASAIIATLYTSDAGIAATDIEDGLLEEAPEGLVLTRMHLARERNRKLVERKKAQALKQYGKLACEVCAFDFAAHYGERGAGFIECHHTKPLASLPQNHRTHLDDLALLYANCHRMIHRARPWLRLSELQQYFHPDHHG